MAHLAVDIGRTSAMAWDGACEIRSESITLSGSSDSPSHLADLERWVERRVTLTRPHRVYVERHTGRGKGSRTLDAYTGVVRTVCARHGVPCDASVTAISARKLALGRGIADKAVAGALARRLLDVPEYAGPDEVDARILLAAIPAHLAKLRAEEEARRLRRNALAKARRHAVRALLPFPATVPA